MAGRTLTATYSSLVTLTNPGDNPVTVVATAALDAGLYGSSSADWTITNYGGITTGVDAANAAARGTAAAVLMASYSTVTNDGGIAASGTYGVGVELTAGGGITNHGSIEASGTHGDGVYLFAGGSVTNAGTVTGANAGIELHAGGSISNQYGALIAGVASGVYLTGASTISNDGTIQGTLGIDGLNGGGVTVVDTGTIASTAGTAGVAIRLGAGSNVLSLAPGAVFVGTVDGGNTIGATYASTLELGVGASAGAIGGIGSQYVNFAQITVDYGATWTLTGTNSVASGATLTTSGTLISDGTLINGGSISQNGTASYGLINLIGGSVTNALGASISSSTGIAIYGPTAASAVTVVNAGQIYGYDVGVYLNSGGMVINLSSGTIIGQGGVGITGGVGTLINDGKINGYGGGAYIETGALTNSASGRITGVAGGVRIGSGAISNYGTIIGNRLLYSYGVALGNATFINHVGGKVSGVTFGVVASASGAATIVNGGSIGGGGIGVYGYSETTLTNAGTITAVGPYSVRFSAGYTNLLVIDPGAVFNGAVDGSYDCGCGGTATNISTMELASGGVGTLGGLGSQYIDFARITIDSSASWVLTGSNSLAAGTTLTNGGTLTLSSASLNDADALVNNGVIVLDPSTLSAAALIGVGAVTIGSGGEFAALGTVAIGETIDFNGAGGVLALGDPVGFAGTIDGFVSGRTIELTGVAHSKADHATLLGGNTLEVVTGSGTFDLQLDPLQNYTGATFPLTANGGGTDIHTSVACFVAGTRLLAPRGAVAVELLRPGDSVLNAGGVVRTVRWVGFRAIDLSRHPDPDVVRPIRILANAFADGVPAREVRLSPDHAVLVDGVLVPARLLVNGASIVRATECRDVVYYHVELDAHDVLLAENLPAESYLDTGNRGMFANADAPTMLHPDFGDGQRRRVMGGCAPFVSEAARVEPMWRRLMARACALGLAEADGSEAVHDAALRVMAGGRLIAA